MNLYYDFETYQPLGLDVKPSKEDEKVIIMFMIGKKKDGLLTFNRATFKQGQGIFEYQFTDTKFNTIEASDFESKANLITENQD